MSWRALVARSCLRRRFAGAGAPARASAQVVASYPPRFPRRQLGLLCGRRRTRAAWRSVPSPRASPRPRGDRRASRTSVVAPARSFILIKRVYWPPKRAAPRASFCATVTWLLRSAVVEGTRACVHGGPSCQVAQFFAAIATVLVFSNAWYAARCCGRAPVGRRRRRSL